MKRKIIGLAAVIGCALAFAALGSACDGSDLTKAIDTIDGAIKGHQHSLVFMAARESTCTERGCIDHWYCSAYNCYKLFADEKGEHELTSGVYFPMLPHTMEFHEKIKPTCTSKGTEAYYQCTSCGGMFNDEQGAKKVDEDYVSLWLNPHTIIYKEEQKPTCTEEGEKGHYFCTVCEKKFSDEHGYRPATDLAIPPAHDVAASWSANASQHWHEYNCEHKELVQKEDHTFEGEVCSVCQFHKPSVGLFYEVNADGETAKLTERGSCTSDAVYIASVYEGKPVTGIADDVFNGCTDIKTVSLPDSLEEIGANAFRGCTNIKDVSLPDSLERIGANAFRGCSKLAQIALPSATTEVGEYAFYGCLALTNVQVSGWDVTIGAHAFDTCYKLRYFNEFTRIKEIGDYAFYNCDALVKLNLTRPDATIGNSAFRSCENLKEIKLSSVKSIGNQAFYQCSNLESVVTGMLSGYTIGDEAFAGCNKLKSVSLARGVETIGDKAFNGCENLTTFTIGRSSKLQTIGNDAFNGCASLATFTMSGNTSLQTIGDRAFYGCAALEKFILPKGLESIGESAFEGCTALQRIDIPSSVTTIKSRAFVNTKAKLYPEVKITPDGWADDWEYGNSTYWGEYVDQDS